MVIRTRLYLDLFTPSKGAYLYPPSTSNMPFGLGEIALIGVVGACIFVGPKRIIPRIAETLKLTRQTFIEPGVKNAAEKAAVKPPSASSTTAPTKAPTTGSSNGPSSTAGGPKSE
eukprot:m.163447 g.163447  ORF g.163447 m.163447 type:complete len:115 (-) comp31293_c0_seq1:47-391(-)